MKRILIFVFAILLGGQIAFAQNGNIILNTPIPNPIPVGGTGTGTFVLTLSTPWPAGEIMNLQGDKPEYPITSVTGPAQFDVFDTSDPLSAWAFSNTDLPAGAYTFTYVITPTGTTTDLVGASLQVNFGNLIGVFQPVTLPVTLISFSAARENTTSLVSWATSEEINSAFFEIQHSTNAKTWTKVGEVPSANAGKILQTYSFTHTETVSNMNYYRLKMVDLDGTYQYSKIVRVDMGELTESVSFGPNPTSDFLTISSGNWAGIKQIRLVDNSGRIVYSSNSLGKPEPVINVSKLSPGLYVLQVAKTNGEIASKKIALSR